MKIFIIAFIIISIFSGCKQNNNVKEKAEISRQAEHTKTLPEVVKTEMSLGEAVTPIIDQNENRVNNIMLACQSISGIEIAPGNEFSFNSTVGERSAQRGYKEAAVLSNGEVCIGVGGGICQVSTTVYMAAVNAGLKIKERHLHSQEVSYAPDRTDATVVYNELDMRFENSTNENIYLYTWVENNNVYAKIVKIEYISN